jgi:tape measure domain-containing protein
MATDIASLKIKVDTKDFNKASMELDKLEGSGKRAERSLGKLPAIFTAIATSMAVREAIQYADTMKLIEGRLSLVTSSASELTKVQKELFDISQRSRVGFADTADLYARMARSTEALGYTSEQLLGVTETISKSFIVSGSSAQAANAAIVQLGQGFASGTLRGEELNSVMEQSPRLAQAIADGMDVTIGQLRQLGADGKLTAETVMNALSSQGDAIRKEFAQMPQTVGQSVTQIGNSIMVLVGEFDKAAGSTDELSGGLSNFSKLIDENRGSIIEFGLDLARSFEVAGTAAAMTYLEAKQTILQIKDFFSSGDGLATEISLIEEQMKLLATDMDSTITKIKEDTQATIENTQAHKDNMESKGLGTEGAGAQTGILGVGGEDEEDNAFATGVEAYENYLLQLEERQDRLMATLYPIEGLEQKWAEQQEVIELLFQEGLITEQERKAQLLNIEAIHQANVNKIIEKSMSARQKFSAKSSKDQLTTVLGDMQKMTAGVAGSNKTMFEINKAAALANAAVQLPASIMKTMENYPFPLSIAMAGLQAAAGAAQIAAISSSSFGGGGGGATSMPTSGGGFVTTPGVAPSDMASPAQEEVETTKEVTINLGDSAIISTEAVRLLVEQINEELGDGVRIRT